MSNIGKNIFFKSSNHFGTVRFSPQVIAPLIPLSRDKFESVFQLILLRLFLFLTIVTRVDSNG
ncbi:Uncharacterised protein [Serratia proteamaculans]|nr:Uncharacterised protein [Serratia proteamaculans]CAI1113675.1 Uncharacterised protein [Serratia proteamaculans]CAI1210720.1 Uncharacterised protein [Serratia proteamaculans]CAI1613476.1 Uncharacterised protein [Serratia proteamaculans]